MIWGFGITKELARIADILEEIALLLSALVVPTATEGEILQTKRGVPMAITGVPQGGTGTFLVTWNGAMQAAQVTSWAADDATVVLTPNGDSVSAAVPAGDTAASFNLTATGINSVGATVTATASVPMFLTAYNLAKWPLAPAMGGDISQTS